MAEWWVYHRGAHPKDRELFGESQLPLLRGATDDLCWLLGRGYTLRPATQLVAERYALADRQREAVSRAACAPSTAERRRACQVRGGLDGKEVWLDGFNVIIISERALGQGPIVLGRDGAFRDLAGVHGAWHRVAETESAISAIGGVLQRLGAGLVRWLLDKAVGNGGRLAASLRESARAHGWPWTVERVEGVDRRIAECGRLVATSDGWIQDRCTGWVNLVSEVVADAPDPWIVDLGQFPG